jgi:acyl carrier protein
MGLHDPGCIKPSTPILRRGRRSLLMNDAKAAIREIVSSYGQLKVGLDSLDDDHDLFDLGMTSHATVNVMLALEDAFNIEFPEELLTKETFESVAAMYSVVSGLLVAA